MVLCAVLDQSVNEAAWGLSTGHRAHHETHQCKVARRPPPKNGRDRTITALAVRDKTTKPVGLEESWPVASRTADGRMGTAPATRGRTTKPVWYAGEQLLKPVGHASRSHHPHDAITATK